MTDFAFEVRDQGKRVGIVLAQAPTEAEARRAARRDLIGQRVVRDRRLTLAPTPVPDLATTTDQIWLTQAAFLARFKPTMLDGDVTYLPTWEPATLDRLAREGRLWTVTGDEPPTLVSGFHFVDRLEYLECAVPHRGAGMILVL
ncbi:MAG: hypothetical protein SF070_08445 [Gemmatimonadota bacterium]|nr:hypothetical protein [Gemmatimonadota bacterium]